MTKTDTATVVDTARGRVEAIKTVKVALKIKEEETVTDKDKDSYSNSDRQ